MYNQNISDSLLADMLSVSLSTVLKWKKSGRIQAQENGLFSPQSLTMFPQVQAMLSSSWEKESQVTSLRHFNSIELFAGAGGLAIGLEKAGFHACMLNEVDKSACATLRHNRPNWNVREGDIKDISFSEFQHVDFVSGGFPCQAFSYAGQKRGFEDTRGTLFFEFARAIKTLQPQVFLGENVRGLLSHDKGRTLASIQAAIQDLGYTLIEPRVLKAMFYQVPQKRERLFLVGIRNDLLPFAEFKWPAPFHRVMTLRDALKKGSLYDSDCPESVGQTYPQRKQEILQLIPQGGCWTSLPDHIQREYMQKSYFMGGGKTGMARRLSWDNPSLTLTCAPAQKQTERCHPEETRPLTVREYARIQTFPDTWEFQGAMGNQYKQIGNAVPINLAHAMGRSLIRLLNSIESNQVQPVDKATLINHDAKFWQHKSKQQERVYHVR